MRCLTVVTCICTSCQMKLDGPMRRLGVGPSAMRILDWALCISMYSYHVVGSGITMFLAVAVCKETW